MDSLEFRNFGKRAVDYIADYLENIRDRQVLSSVEPGYLKNLLPSAPPKSGESWHGIFQDLDNIIVPGLTHWHSPHFHAYCPTANSYPGIVGELMLSGFGIISSNWFSNPACVELELIVMNWLGKMLGLPKDFLNGSEGTGKGCGVIQNAASESTLVALLTAKKRKIQTFLKKHPGLSATLIESKLIAYTSEESNSSVEKATVLASVAKKLLPTDSDGALRGQVLLENIVEDINNGFIPCCVIATLGTTGTCSFDKLDEIGPICEKYNIWLHVDAAYAGSALVCPEYRYLITGIRFVDSFNINPHKWMLINSDCSAMWFKDKEFAEKTFKVDDKHKINQSIVTEVENWQIPNMRRFRALKMWFVLRIYGVQGIQKHIRDQISLAQYLESVIKSDQRFEVCRQVMGLVCFRLNGEDELTQKVIDEVTKRKDIFIMPYYYRKKLVIRLVICSRVSEKRDVDFAWKEIVEQAEKVLQNEEINRK